MEKIPVTANGYARLTQELAHLKHDERPAVIRAIAEAREHGDLSENAEYHAARERQSFIEGRIIELENILGRAEVIPAEAAGEAKSVRFSAFVVLSDEDTGLEAEYQLVGAPEADFSQRRIAVTSPMGRALIGRNKGDTVEVSTPGGVKTYEILRVFYA